MHAQDVNSDRYKYSKIEILHLTVKKKWFDMIAANIKKEEYRAIKNYWISRLIASVQRLIKQEYFDDVPVEHIEFNHYDAVEFKNGYSKNAPRVLIECQGITIGKPKDEWCGMDFIEDDGGVDDCFIIKLGNMITT